MSITGHATESGTRNYTESFPKHLESNFYRNSKDCWVSSLGLGTYLGDATDEVDENYEESLRTALTEGINLIDTAINYRFQRSERVIGDVLQTLIDDSGIERDEVLVATKGGFVPFDEQQPDEPLDYIRDTFIEPGIAHPDDFTRNGHCMKPDYIEHQLHRSLDNLNLETVDIYYVHNPEMQFSHKDHQEVYDQLERVFERLETMADQGKLDSYGIATWDGLRVDPRENNYLKLESVHERARAAGGEDHNFDAVQLPFNLGMSEALTKANQPLEEEPLTPLEAAKQLDLLVATSASILQGRLTKNLPEEIQQDLQEFDKDILRSLQFTRSAPGVTSALVGMSNPDHVRENLELTNYDPFGDEEFKERFLEEVQN